MKKGIAALVTVAALTMGLSACGGSGSNSADSKKEQTSSQEKTEKKTEAPKPADFTGTWKQVNGADKDHYQQATVAADKIDVNWVSPDSTSLYWSGSFTPRPPPATIRGPAKATRRRCRQACSPLRTLPRTSSIRTVRSLTRPSRWAPRPLSISRSNDSVLPGPVSAGLSHADLRPWCRLIRFPCSLIPRLLLWKSWNPTRTTTPPLTISASKGSGSPVSSSSAITSLSQPAHSSSSSRPTTTSASWPSSVPSTYLSSCPSRSCLACGRQAIGPGEHKTSSITPSASSRQSESSPSWCSLPITIYSAKYAISPYSPSSCSSPEQESSAYTILRETGRKTKRTSVNEPCQNSHTRYQMPIVRTTMQQFAAPLTQYRSSVIVRYPAVEYLLSLTLAISALVLCYRTNLPLSVPHLVKPAVAHPDMALHPKHSLFQGMNVLLIG